ncbi:MAG: glycosyltransferase [Anaerolineae bacterium]|nr:glycosyltransferase [Anaerolineae bacterium]
MSAQPELRVAMLSIHTCPLATLGGKKTGGMNVYVRELSRELSRRNVQVDIFTRSQDPCVPHINASELGTHARVIHVPAGPETPLSALENFRYLDVFSQAVIDFAGRNRLWYDVIHSHYWLSGLVAERLKAEWGVPSIQMFHTLGRMKNRIAQDTNEIEPDLRLDSESAIMRQTDHLVAATPAERIQMMWLYGADMRKITVIPPGVDTRQFYPVPRAKARQAIGVPDDHTLLLFVGRLEPLKGVDTLLKAIALLKEHESIDTHRLYLSIIGGNTSEEGDEAEEFRRLKALNEELGLGDMVTFLGAKGQETLRDYYAAAEVVIMPSHYESFGMVALEAMACGTPVIASEVGGLAYLIQDGVTGFHVPDRDPEELAGKIGLLLGNHTLRMEMSEASVRHAEQYAWERVTTQIQELYAGAIARH